MSFPVNALDASPLSLRDLQQTLNRLSLLLASVREDHFQLVETLVVLLVLRMLDSDLYRRVLAGTAKDEEAVLAFGLRKSDPRQAGLEREQDERRDAVIVGRAVRAVVAQVGSELGGHRRGPDRAALPFEEERLIAPAAPEHAEGVRLDGAGPAVEAKVARGPMGRIDLGHLQTFRTGLVGQRGQEPMHGLSVDEPAPLLNAMSREQVAPLQVRSELRDPAARDAEQRPKWLARIQVQSPIRPRVRFSLDLSRSGSIQSALLVPPPPASERGIAFRSGARSTAHSPSGRTYARTSLRLSTAWRDCARQMRVSPGASAARRSSAVKQMNGAARSSRSRSARAERRLGLEARLIGVFGLTPPPAYAPWRERRRDSELDWRRRALGRLHWQLRLTSCLHWLLRVMTLGPWGREKGA